MHPQNTTPLASSHLDSEQKVLMKRVANVYNDFKPIPWLYGEISVLKDEDGLPLGFYCSEKNTVRESLPAEIFNHQMKGLSHEDADALAAFMSEFGVIFDSWPGALGEMSQYCKFVDVRRYGKPDISQIDAAINYLESGIGLGPQTSQGRLFTHDLWVSEYERMRVFASEGWDAFEPRLFLVSIEEVCENLDTISSLVKLAKSASQSEDEETISLLAGIERCNLTDEILYLDQTLNALLHVFHPKVGFQYVIDGQPGKPTYDCDYWESVDDFGPTSASLMNAIALQIRDFNLRLSDARQCAECGEIFIVKQSSKPVKRAHSDSMFCCDRCKNRHAQRKHRSTEGYKQKQARKKPFPPGRA